ncbi:MAG: VOC family protein [Candidatus Binatia bacterium]|jgi:catechol 2,3-dioxygenase-like lactoylglutathione lyase family enzyme
MVAEIRFGVESIDHIAVPVRDLEINQAFYVDVLGLQFKTTRRNPDGTPRQTYVLAGKNTIGLHLPGVLAGASPGAAPRIGIGATRERLEQTQQNLKAANHPFRGPVEHGDGPLALSIYFDDPEGNHLEFCLRRSEPLGECISHTVFETLNMKKAMTFYSEALGSGVPIACGNEMLIPAQNGQMIGLVEVEKLSDRSKKHGRGCHMAMDVPQDDFDSMVALVERYGGKTQGDRRAEDGLRPPGERSIYFFDPDNNRLQITAHAPNQVEELLSDQEKWRRIVASRKAQGRGLSRWESGGKKVI